jgi:hypothetical protein
MSSGMTGSGYVKNFPVLKSTPSSGYFFIMLAVKDSLNIPQFGLG